METYGIPEKDGKVNEEKNSTTELVELKVATETQQPDTAYTSITNDETLPDGWEKAFTEAGQPFYINHTTQTTQWKRPIDPAQNEPPTKPSMNAPRPIPHPMMHGQSIDEKVQQPMADNEIEEVLPDGWSKVLTSDGKPYYQNSITKKTQWIKPSTDNLLPSGWTSVCTPDGKIYYQNYITKATQWERPQSSNQVIASEEALSQTTIDPKQQR